MMVRSDVIDWLCRDKEHTDQTLRILIHKVLANYDLMKMTSPYWPFL